MSLIRLLTTTRSLSDVKNEPSPYRMTEQALLPKFGRKTKPHEAKDNLGEGNGDRTDAGCSLKSESSRKPKWLVGWWEKWFRRRPRRERREPVQAELALDLVKVVRNELCEAEALTPALSRREREERGARKKEEPQPEESVFGAAVR